MESAALHERARTRGANPAVYWIVRALFQPVFHVYFRMSRIGREHIPKRGPVIIAANHRSFLDPFVIGTMARRPMYYVAKKELFRHRLLAWLLNSLGAFPVDRGAADLESMGTAKALLERGEIVLIFVEGTRVRPGALGKPRKGVGRLALESGAPVVPVAVIGTEAVRQGWRIRPHKVRIRAGRPLRFPCVPDSAPKLATAVTARIWPCVMLQWEWLGGLAPIRRVAIIGAGCRGTRLALCLARAGFDVELGCRTAEQAAAIARTGINERYLPGVKLPARITVRSAAQLELAGPDLVCLAMPVSALPEALAIHGPRVTRRSALLVLSGGLVESDGAPASLYAAAHSEARAVGVLAEAPHPHGAFEAGAPALVASDDVAFAGQLADALRAAGLDVSRTDDVIGVELAGCARDVAAVAAAAAAPAGAAVAAEAAAGACGEAEELARAHGARQQTLAAIVGSGDLTDGAPPRAALEIVAMLTRAARACGLPTPLLDGLLEILEGRTRPEAWIEAVTQARDNGRSSTTRAA